MAWLCQPLKTPLPFGYTPSSGSQTVFKMGETALYVFQPPIRSIRLVQMGFRLQCHEIITRCTPIHCMGLIDTEQYRNICPYRKKNIYVNIRG